VINASLVPYDPNQADTLRALISRHERVGFSGPSSSASKWYGGFRPELVHFLKTPRGEILGSAGILHDEFGGGLWCGGRYLSGTSVTSLVVEPAARGRGVASVFVEEIIRDAAARKVALCTLYPSRLELYRKGGFELVSDYEVLEIDPAKIRPVHPCPAASVRSKRPHNHGELVALRAAVWGTREEMGSLVRDDPSWQM